MTEARRTAQFVLYKGKPQRHSGSQFYVFARTARQCVYFHDFAIATMRRCVTISRVRSIDRSMSFSPFVDLFLFPSIFMSVDFVWARFRGFEVSIFIFPALGLLGFGIWDFGRAIYYFWPKMAEYLSSSKSDLVLYAQYHSTPSHRQNEKMKK